MTKVVPDAQKFGCPFIPCGKAKIIELFLQSSNYTSYPWWGWQYRNITFTEDLDVDVKAVRQLLDEDDSTDEAEAAKC